MMKAFNYLKYRHLEAQRIYQLVQFRLSSINDFTKVTSSFNSLMSGSSTSNSRVYNDIHPFSVRAT